MHRCAYGIACIARMVRPLGQQGHRQPTETRLSTSGRTYRGDNYVQAAVERSLHLPPHALSLLPVIKSVILDKDRFWAMVDLTGTSTRKTA